MLNSSFFLLRLRCRYSQFRIAPDMRLSFNNTETAFAYKTNNELQAGRFLFGTMNYPWFSEIGVRLTPFLMKTGLPIHGMIRKTIFKQFVGGETLEQTADVAKKLGEYDVQVILDYGVEAKQGEKNFDKARDEFMRVIEYAATQPNIPFISVKVTGIASFRVIENIKLCTAFAQWRARP